MDGLVELVVELNIASLKVVCIDANRATDLRGRRARHVGGEDGAPRSSPKVRQIGVPCRDADGDLAVVIAVDGGDALALLIHLADVGIDCLGHSGTDALNFALQGDLLAGKSSEGSLHMVESKHTASLRIEVLGSRDLSILGDQDLTILEWSRDHSLDVVRLHDWSECIIIQNRSWLNKLANI